MAKGKIGVPTNIEYPEGSQSRDEQKRRSTERRRFIEMARWEKATPIGMPLSTLEKAERFLARMRQQTR